MGWNAEGERERRGANSLIDKVLENTLRLLARECVGSSRYS